MPLAVAGHLNHGMDHGLYSAAMSSNVQYATMWPFLPFDITSLIIDIVGGSKDTVLLKELSLVSHSFHQICSKHLFATVDLHDANCKCASSKKRFIKLVKSRPNVVNYIRKVTYKVSYVNDINDDDHLLSPILSNFLPTTSRLNSLAIIAFSRNWNLLDSSLTSAFLHLMRFPTVNHIDLSNIKNFPFSSLPQSVNLHRLDINTLTHFDQPEIVVESEMNQMMPKIREFHTSDSYLSTTKLLHAKMHDGRPAFNFMDLRRLWIFLMVSEDERNFRYLLQNAKLLEKLHLSVLHGQGLMGLHDILSPIARTLKVLSFSVSADHPALAGLYEELEAMTGHYMVEALSIEFIVDSELGDDTVDSVGCDFQKVEKVLVKPGWSALRQVSFIVSSSFENITPKLTEVFQSLPDIYLSHLSKLESVSFNFSISVQPDSFLF